jgi:plastocyanin
VNDSDVGHTVTAYEGRIPERAGYFASGGFETERGARNDVRGGLLDADESYEHTFEVEGEYGYFCVPHESSGMTGTVVVG